MFFAALTVLASAGLFAAGCDEYDDLPIVGESASAEELETWREIRSEYESAVGN